MEHHFIFSLVSFLTTLLRCILGTILFLWTLLLSVYNSPSPVNLALSPVTPQHPFFPLPLLSVKTTSMFDGFCCRCIPIVSTQTTCFFLVLSPSHKPLNEHKVLVIVTIFNTFHHSPFPSSILIFKLKTKLHGAHQILE